MSAFNHKNAPINEIKYVSLNTRFVRTKLPATAMAAAASAASLPVYQLMT